MTEAYKKKIIRQRVQPRIYDFSYLITRSNKAAFLEFRQKLTGREKLRFLDVGCGFKPFKKLLDGVEVAEYVGVDFDAGRSAADIVASIEKLPLQDDSFGAIIVSEVLEHTLALSEGVGELRRVARDGALLFISTPFLFGEHGVPYDFQRLTRYKYRDLFKADEILALRPTNCNLASPFLAFNLSFELVPYFSKLPLIAPLCYALNNLFGLVAEGLVAFLRAAVIGLAGNKERAADIFEKSFYNLPGGFNLIVKVKKSV